MDLKTDLRADQAHGQRRRTHRAEGASDFPEGGHQLLQETRDPSSMPISTTCSAPCARRYRRSRSARDAFSANFDEVMPEV
jgi:hypothetical protein